MSQADDMLLKRFKLMEKKLFRGLGAELAGGTEDEEGGPQASSVREVGVDVAPGLHELDQGVVERGEGRGGGHGWGSYFFSVTWRRRINR
jgi:hypothetical protein